MGPDLTHDLGRAETDRRGALRRLCMSWSRPFGLFNAAFARNSIAYGSTPAGTALSHRAASAEHASSTLGYVDQNQR